MFSAEAYTFLFSILAILFMAEWISGIHEEMNDFKEKIQHLEIKINSLVP
jgi:hypothetical protein